MTVKLPPIGGVPPVTANELNQCSIGTDSLVKSVQWLLQANAETSASTVSQMDAMMQQGQLALSMMTPEQRKSAVDKALTAASPEERKMMEQQKKKIRTPLFLRKSKKKKTRTLFLRSQRQLAFG